MLMPAIKGVISGSGGGAGAVVLEDTFTDTDYTAIADHSPEIGGTWIGVWNPSYASPNIVSNQMVSVANTSGQSYGIIDIGSWSTMTIEVTIVQSATLYAFPRAVFRVDDMSLNYGTSDNFFYVYIDPYQANNHVRLGKYVVNAHTELDSVEVVAPLGSSNIDLTITDDGENISVTFTHGGADYELTATDTTYASATKVGAGASRNAACGADYIKVETTS